ncbi:MAG: competence protein ComEC family protein, partial [Bacilli bacterium]|nr:competence protein ComEC family protein [Bacilli bacterium]
MKRLKIILQSKKFITVSLIFLSIYIFLFTKFITYDSVYPLDTTNLSGTILDYKIDGDKLSLLVLGEEKVQVSYYFKSKDEKELYESNLKLGMRVNLDGTISVPSNNTIPNTFNYKDYLYNKKIYRIFTASKIALTNDKISLPYQLKNFFLKRVNSFTMTSSYMHAFILGDKGYIDNDVYQNYSNNGVTHLFAVSGMHVTFLVIVLISLLKKFHLKEKMVNFIIIIFLLIYMFLIGFSASVVRASLLYVLLLFNKKIGLNLKSKNVLYLLFLNLLIINPFYIYDLGFIYSFLTSFGLILFNHKINGNYFK